MRRSVEPFRRDAPSVSELAAGAVIAREGTGLLLLLHHLGEDRWCLPKGHVEAGESIEQAAAREVREETGLEAFRLTEEIGAVTYRFYDPRRKLSVVKTSIYFLGLTSEENVRPEPLFDLFRWVRPEAALDLVAYETDREVLRAARDAIGRSAGR